MGADKVFDHWEPIYEFGDYKPIAWVNHTTGQVVYRPRPALDLPEDRSQESVEEWLAR